MLLLSRIRVFYFLRALLLIPANFFGFCAKISFFAHASADPLRALSAAMLNLWILSQELEVEVLQPAQHLGNHVLLGKDGGPEFI